MSSYKANFAFFILLLILVSLGFFSILLPFYSAIFWAVIFVVIFKPMHNFILSKMPKHVNLAALLSLIICIFVGLIPLALLSAALVQEVIMFATSIDHGDINVGEYFSKIVNNTPDEIQHVLSFFGIQDITELQSKIQDSMSSASRYVANQFVALGQRTFSFFVSLGIMLYLMYFLFRDGYSIMQHFRNTIPLSAYDGNHILEKFITVVKATVKGNVSVAIAQGFLGGIIFWILGIQGPLLWGVIMAFLSLVPAVGSALIWFPVAVYFLSTHQVVSGVVLILYGIFVISLADNVLRPILVGKSTKLPDYMILISTVGGLAVFGPNGFVIGPLVSALFLACWQLFAESLREHEHVIVSPRETTPVSED